MEKTYFCATFVTWDGQFQVELRDSLLSAQKAILELAKKKGFDAVTIDDLWTVRAGQPFGKKFNINIERLVIKEEDSASIPITFL